MASLLEPQIIYEDADLLAVNKPAGLSVHADGFSDKPTLADWLIQKYPEMKNVGEPMLSQSGKYLAKPGIVHRLDKDTSGVLLVAKNQTTFIFLKEQFKKRETKKTYRMLVYGNIKLAEGEEGVINIPIGRSRNDPRLRVASPKAVSKHREAITHYKVLKNFDDFTYLEVYPKTGRTHQLRAHFKAIQHPLVCDSLYAPGKPCPSELSRQALHAYSLEFIHPNGKTIKLTAPLPEDFKSTIASLEKDCPPVANP